MGKDIGGRNKLGLTKDAANIVEKIGGIIGWIIGIILIIMIFL